MATSSATALVAVAAIGFLPDSATDSAMAADEHRPAIISSQLAMYSPPASAAAPDAAQRRAVAADRTAAAIRADEGLPADSGKDRRIVFSKSRQRIWLVTGDGSVARTYLVSGSVHDNVSTGSHRVQVKTRVTTAYDYQSTLEYFVRFTTGRTAAIGFHDIPVDNDGDLMQTKAELGTALSSGCVRQDRPDAIALWEFASVGTAVEVLS